MSNCKVNKNLKDLTGAERFWVSRQINGWSQARQAKKLGICEKVYWELENDLRVIDGVSAPEPLLEPWLMCKLARRRHDLTLGKTAKLLGCSSPTLLRREAVGDPVLVAGWRNLGYRF